MDKTIRAHEQYVKAEIGKFEAQIKDTKTLEEKELLNKKIDDLHKYHTETVRNFQHERSIHLMVTFFFAGLLLLSVVILFLLTLSPITSNQAPLGVMIAVVSLILFITELFYIRYYYALENGIQKLYVLSKKLYEIII